MTNILPIEEYGHNLGYTHPVLVAWDDDAERKVALYEHRLLPLARQSYASAEAAYRAGAVGFDGLIGAHEIALEFELGLARARADRAKKSAVLEKLLGRSVPTAPTHE